jgi:uncharacterized paraquat-inducible protein A
MTKSNRIESLLNFYDIHSDYHVKVLSNCHQCKKIKLVKKFQSPGSKTCNSCRSKKIREKKKMSLQTHLVYKQPEQFVYLTKLG